MEAPTSQAESHRPHTPVGKISWSWLLERYAEPSGTVSAPRIINIIVHIGTIAAVSLASDMGQTDIDNYLGYTSVYLRMIVVIFTGHGRRMIHAGSSSLFGLGLQVAHVPTFWLIPSISPKPTSYQPFKGPWKGSPVITLRSPPSIQTLYLFSKEACSGARPRLPSQRPPRRGRGSRPRGSFRNLRL